MLKALTIAAALWLAAGPAGAQPPGDAELCAGVAADNVAACTRLIEDGQLSVQNQAIAFFSRGTAFRAKGENDRAIADFDKAIALDPKYAFAYANRGHTLLAKGEIDRAIADLDRAIVLAPRLGRAWYTRGSAYLAKGEPMRAIADFDKSIALDPPSVASFRSLGNAKYDKGDFLDAARDFLRAIELADEPYAMIFRYLARARAGQQGGEELAANATRLKTKAWPYAVVELYLGHRSPAATLDAAATAETRCEAAYYVGAWHLLKTNKVEARTSFETAAAACPKDFVEYSSAVADLKRLAP